jgi:hypothetical protein
LTAVVYFDDHASVKNTAVSRWYALQIYIWHIRKPAILSCHNFTVLQTDSNKMPRRHLKGSRKVQTFPLNLNFGGGTVSGIATGGGSATGSGTTTNGDVNGITSATGSGEFTSNSGSSGFVTSPFGTAQGMAAGGSTGSQLGSVLGTTGVGTLSFDGTTDSSGAGVFGAGFSPVQFNAVTTAIPGTPGVSGGSKKKGLTGGTSATTVTNFVPSLNGPTGGFGGGNGIIDITSGSTGTLAGADAIGVGTSLGSATNFGGGSGSATNLFGGAGGLGSGAGTGGATGGGTTTLDVVGGTFIGGGVSNGNFNNVGSGFFGAPASINFPCC